MATTIASGASTNLRISLGGSMGNSCQRLPGPAR